VTAAAGDRDAGRPVTPDGGPLCQPGGRPPDPRGPGPHSFVTGPWLLDISELAVRFGPVRAVDGVSLQLPPGPCGLGLVGESGSGKTTIGRAALRDRKSVV